jgi:hypothetical protein
MNAENVAPTTLKPSTHVGASMPESRPCCQSSTASVAIAAIPAGTAQRAALCSSPGSRPTIAISAPSASVSTRAGISTYGAKALCRCGTEPCSIA